MSWIKKHYHWLVAGLVMLHLMIHGGIINSNSLFLLPVSEDFGVSRSTVTLPGSLRTIASFIFSFFSGALLLRFGYRKLMTACLAVVTTGLFVLSASSNMALYYVGSLLFGITESFCIQMSAPRVVNTWFHRYRGTVLGVVTSSTGLGGSLLCVILSAVIENTGWQKAYLVSALLMVAPLLLIPIFVRDRPEQMKLRPLGEGQHSVKKKENADLWAGFTYRQVVRSPLFYILMLGTFLSSFFSYAVFHNLVPHLQDQGFSIQQAAAMQSILMIGLAASKLGCGFLTDLIGARKVTILCLIACAISPLLFSFTVTPALAVVGVLLSSIALTLTSIMVPLVSASLFGYQAQASYLGMQVAMITLAGAVCLPIANLVFDRVGSYKPFLLVSAAGSVLLVGMYLVLYKLADRKKARLLATAEEI